jgi:hypothetical protein
MISAIITTKFIMSNYCHQKFGKKLKNAGDGNNNNNKKERRRRNKTINL